jgi:hypothetical protein
VAEERVEAIDAVATRRGADPWTALRASCVRPYMNLFDFLGFFDQGAERIH